MNIPSKGIIMKRVFNILFTIIFLISCASTDVDVNVPSDFMPESQVDDEINNNVDVLKTSSSDDLENLAKFSRILDQYEMVILEYGDPDSPYYEAYEIFKEKLDAGETSFRYNPDNNKKIKGTASFQYDIETGEYFISAGPGLIESYATNPSFVFAVLAHEHWHARDYILYYEHFIAQIDDPFEAEYFEADAIWAEAIFINDIFLANNFSVSKFESYLVDCVSNNKLSSFTSSMYKIDLDLLHRFSDIIENFNRVLDRDKMDNELLNEGNNLLSKYNTIERNSTRQLYQTLVSIKTYIEFSAILFRKTEGHIDEKQLWEDVLVMYPGYNEVRAKLYEVLDANTDFINKTNSKYIQYFEEDLLIERSN